MPNIAIVSVARSIRKEDLGAHLERLLNNKRAPPISLGESVTGGNTGSSRRMALLRLTMLE